jgi:hypothetical protein
MILIQLLDLFDRLAQFCRKIEHYRLYSSSLFWGMIRFPFYCVHR